MMDPARQMARRTRRPETVDRTKENPMRNPVLLVAATLVLAACADDHPSAPTATRTVASRSLSPLSSTAPSPQAKPTDQVGFTKVVEVQGVSGHVDAGAAGVASVACPAGTMVVGGTYRLVFFDAASTPPWIYKNDTDGQNGWSVTIVNEQPGSFGLTYRAIAYCAS